MFRYIFGGGMLLMFLGYWAQVRFLQGLGLAVIAGSAGLLLLMVLVAMFQKDIATFREDTDRRRVRYVLLYLPPQIFLGGFLGAGVLILANAVLWQMGLRLPPPVMVAVFAGSAVIMAMAMPLHIAGAIAVRFLGMAPRPKTAYGNPGQPG